MGCEVTSPGWKHRHVSGKVHLLHEQGYVIRCVGNLTEEKTHINIYIYLPTAYEYQKYVENRIWKLPNDGVRVDSKGFVTMVYNTRDYWVLGFCPSSGILKNATFRKRGPVIEVSSF
jgi:hypothetical protein